MNILSIFRKKQNANLEWQKEFLLKATTEIARREGADIGDFAGFLCPQCYEKLAMRTADVKGAGLKCPKCGSTLLQAF